MPQNKKQKVKKIKPKARVKKQKKTATPQKKARTEGKRIAVKVINEPKQENVYGAISESENLASQLIDETTPVFPDFDFSDNQEDIESDWENNSAAIAADEDEIEPILEAEEINDEPMTTSQEDYLEEESDPFNGLSPRHKNLIMYISISCIMLVVIGFWVLGLKASLSKNYESTADDSNLEEIKQSFQDITDNFGDITSQWQVQQKVLEDFSSQAKQKILEEKMKNSITEQMKEKITNPQQPVINENINLNANSINTNSQ